MELPQPRPFGTQARKPTHDFLSLYSPAQQDPSATPSGGYLETHDFLQPLERVSKSVTKEGNKAEEILIGKSLPPVPPPPPPTAVEHILPGGIGTYSISHISCISQSQRMPKPEGVVINATQAQSSGSDKNDENSNCSSYTGSGFSLWEESVVKKGKTGKENIAGNRHVVRDGGMKIGGVPWMTSMERPSQSSSAHNHPTTTISSLSSSRPSAGQKNQSFVDMLKSAKNSLEDEDEEEEEFVIKKEPSSHYKSVLSVKVDTTHHEQKPNTPRSKHSATEQRRRSKINDRFSMLRELIPHGDQKRDKASFLLEVIQYIQFLQEKVHKYEDSCRGWTNEQPTITPWKNNERPTEGFIDPPHQNGVSTAPLPYTPNLNENKCNSNSSLKKGQNILTDCSVDKLKDEELTIQSGTISISSIYSQGLLSTLTQALQTSGVDLSQAKISVQIDLGKRATHDSSQPVFKKNEAPAIDETVARSRLASTREDNNALKRFKTTRN